MPKTRDLVLFVIIITVLCVGIASTLAFGHYQTLLGTVLQSLVVASSSVESAFVAVAPVSMRDRTSVISHLRDAVLSYGISEENPSVETVELAQDTQEEAKPDEVVVPAAQIQRCTNADDSLLALQHWPLTGVSIEVSNGTRFVMYTQESELSQTLATSSSSTTVVLAKVAPLQLLRMQMYPQKQGVVSCVPSEIVGVTVLGGLISNTDASFYRASDATVLLGYARDGFPIYGVYDGEVDSCGGYMHPEGYRYTIGKNRDFILGCYVATPQAFTL